MRSTPREALAMDLLQANLLRPLARLALNFALGYLLLLAALVLARCYKLLWCGRSSRLLPVEPTDAVLITGATSGFGLVVAKHLHACGYSIVAGCFDEREPGYAELKALSEKEESGNGKRAILLLAMDVRSLDRMDVVCAELERWLREKGLKLFGLINNAGVGAFTPFAMCNKRQMVATLETNLTGTLLSSRLFLPLLAERAGRLLVVSSGLGLLPGPTYLAYGVTKAAQLFFTRCLNSELAQFKGAGRNVKCVTIVPHNFIKHTNIASSSLKLHQELWESELSERERSLYESDYESHKRRLDRFCALGEQFRSERSKADNQPSSLRNSLCKLLHSLSGENTASGVDDPEVLRAFELALRLPSPPEEIFAGDKVFNLLGGPILLTLPNCLLSLIGRVVNENLYK